MLQLVVGLGNPGAAYASTRHNAGFWLVDALAARANVAWTTNAKFNGEVAELPAGDLHAHKIRLLKPHTFMNLSGEAVVAICHYFKIPLNDMLVAHDEADCAVGQIKLKHGGGAAGHKGIADISRRLGSGDYWRLRIGIGKPPASAQSSGGRIDQYVLQPPSKADAAAIHQSIARILGCWQHLAAANYAAAQQALHTFSS